MNGLAPDITAIAAATLFVSVGALWLGCMWHHRSPTPRPKSISDLIVSPPHPTRRIWSGEPWDDPRNLYDAPRKG